MWPKHDWCHWVLLILSLLRLALSLFSFSRNKMLSISLLKNQRAVHLTGIILCFRCVYLLGPVKSLFMQIRPHCALLPQPRTSSTIWYYNTTKEQHMVHATVLHCHVLIHVYMAINQNNWVKYKKICNKIKLIITGSLIIYTWETSM